MPVFKDEKRNTWYVRYKTRDWTGKKIEVWKRGFPSKREAKAWEVDSKANNSGTVNVTFSFFVENEYLKNMEPRIKFSTFITKKSIIDNYILPYFADKKVADITPVHITRWQSEIMRIRDAHGNPFKPSYLKTINNQMAAILNYAVRYYELPRNPMRNIPRMGSETGIEMDFWTKEEYKKFAEAMLDEPMYYYCFEILYWTGLREGEMLALTLNDIDFEAATISVTKTFYVLKGREIVTTPKTPQSVRIVTIPDFLVEELKEYTKLIYGLKPTDRLFPVSKSMLARAMDRGSKKAGVKRIRIHDLRHSHVSLLINMGYPTVAIAKRVGHKSIDITYRYAHMFPSVQQQISDDLNNLNKED